MAHKIFTGKTSALLAGCATIAIAVSSCRPHVRSDGKSTDGTDPADAYSFTTLASRLFAKPEDRWIRIEGSPDGGVGLVAEIGEGACADPAGQAADHLRFRVHLASVFGTYPIAVTLHAAHEAKGALARAQVENSTLEFSENWRPNEAWLASTCEKHRSGTSPIAADRELALAVAGWMQRVAPDCEFREISENGWQCELPTIEPHLAAGEISRVKRIMIATWSRQPYLLARRIGVSLSLARALESDRRTRSDRELVQICKVVTNSLPLEIPATLASERWQSAACGSGSAESRQEAALAGLSKSLSEIEFLRQLFENTSKLGTLVVRVPHSNVPYRALLVSLMPEPDVAEAITREASAIWSPRGGAQTKGSAPRVCWHPIFAESPRLLTLASQLDLVGDSPGATCTGDLRGEVTVADAPSPEIYLAESITSDTEFVLNNGTGKMLRLPIGSYRYTLRALPESPAEWDDVEAAALASSSGTITWERKRPRPAIRSW